MSGDRVQRACSSLQMCSSPYTQGAAGLEGLGLIWICKGRGVALHRWSASCSGTWHVEHDAFSGFGGCDLATQ